METKPQKLLDQVREAIRMKHYSYRTEQAYVDWIKRFILSHSKRHPKEMAAEEVQGYISYLANERKVAASTHTVLVVGARGTRRSVPSCSCINTFFKMSSTFLPTSCAPAAPNTCQPFSRTRKRWPLSVK